MTKFELLKALAPFTDETEIFSTDKGGEHVPIVGHGYARDTKGNGVFVVVTYRRRFNVKRGKPTASDVKAAKPISMEQAKRALRR